VYKVDKNTRTKIIINTKLLEAKEQIILDNRISFYESTQNDRKIEKRREVYKTTTLIGRPPPPTN